MIYQHTISAIYISQTIKCSYCKNNNVDIIDEHNHDEGMATRVVRFLTSPSQKYLCASCTNVTNVTYGVSNDVMYHVIYSSKENSPAQSSTNCGWAERLHRQ